MSDHLPECDWGAPHIKPLADEVFGRGFPCPLCRMLRACEARVEEAMDRAWTHTLRIKQSEAFANGVQAARDAVAALCDCVHLNGKHASFCAIQDAADALAAIDALRKNK